MTDNSVAGYATKGLLVLVVGAVLALAGTAFASDDADWDNGPRLRQPEAWRDRYPGFNDRQPRPIYGGNGLPSVLPRIGTYTGGLSAIEVPGNGIYIQVDHNRGARALPGNPVVEDNGNAKIIRVTPSNNRSACSYEAGVCVVRP